MDDYSRKYLMDVLKACEEVDSFFPEKRIFADFCKRQATPTRRRTQR